MLAQLHFSQVLPPKGSLFQILHKTWIIAIAEEKELGLALKDIDHDDNADTDRAEGKSVYVCVLARQLEPHTGPHWVAWSGLVSVSNKINLI